jgi:hypothetical protein
MSLNKLHVVNAAALLAAACSSAPLSVDRCNIRLAVISPDPARLQVGQAVTLEAQLTPPLPVYRLTLSLPISDGPVTSLGWRPSMRSPAA